MSESERLPGYHNGNVCHDHLKTGEGIIWIARYSGTSCVICCRIGKGHR